MESSAPASPTGINTDGFMRKKRKSHGSQRAAGGYDHIAANTDFYSTAPSEQPLFQDKKVSDARHVRKTGRHKAVGGRKKEGVDPREKMALVAILKSCIMILLLVIAFFMLRKGISLYEEKVWMDTQGKQEASPVMREVVLVEDFSIEDQDARELFAERIEVWKESERLVRSAEGLLKRNNIDQAIERCQDALRLDAAHMGALELLGTLYFQQGMNIEAINSYIRLLSVEPAREDLQEKLIQALDAHGDADAVVYMARWYLEQNTYDEDIQRYLAHALFAKEEYAKAVEAYDRVLKDSPKDVVALEQQVQAHMILEQYDQALKALTLLNETNYRDPVYYKNIAVCHAQLGHSLETVQTLGKGAHLFGPKVVIGWIQDPRLEPVRDDRSFQAFAERVGGEEFRRYLEQMAKTMEGQGQTEPDPQLKLPDQPEMLQDDLLKPREPR